MQYTYIHTYKIDAYNDSVPSCERQKIGLTLCAPHIIIMLTHINLALTTQIFNHFLVFTTQLFHSALKIVLKQRSSLLGSEALNWPVSVLNCQLLCLDMVFKHRNHNRASIFIVKYTMVVRLMKTKTEKRNYYNCIEKLQLRFRIE